MNALIQLVSFIIFAGFISLGNLNIMLAGGGLLLLTWILCRFVPSKNSYKVLKRLRILFISITGIYAWFTPGQLILPDLDRWSPTWEGLTGGAERILALVILVMAVETYIRLSSREKILSGLYYFARPLEWIGLDRERFMVRTLLTLELAMGKNPDTMVKPVTTNQGNYVSRISQAVLEKVEHAISAPARMDVINVTLEDKPRLLEWCLPLSLIALFYLIGKL